ncbi:Kinesin-like protein kif23, partial [Spiromyces aspiralis]
MVDLAGSERAKRTQNRGDRLAEASKINTSLMTLKKCLDIKRYNTQLTDDELSYDMLQIVPYNESKLTRLFQPALEGGARTVMLVCVDPWDSPENPTTESKNVLDFARVASSIIVRVRKPSSPPPPMLPTTSTHSLPAGDISATTVDSARDGGGSDHQEGEIEGATKLLPKRAYAAESDSDASYGSDPGSDSNINSSSKKNKKKKTRLTLEGTWNYTNGSPPSQASPPSLSPPPSPSKVDSGVSDPGKESPERIVKPNPHVPGRLSGVFGFRE